MQHSQGTFLELERGPFACGFAAGRALCPDGVVRAVRFTDGIADTFFSVPCRVQAYGKTVAGYVTVETVDGFTTPTDDDPAIVRFFPYTYRANHAVFAAAHSGEES